MKQIFGTLFLGVVLLLAACGPAASEVSDDEKSSVDDAALALETGDESSVSQPARKAEDAVADAPPAVDVVAATGDVEVDEPDAESIADGDVAAQQPAPAKESRTTALEPAAAGSLTAEEVAGLQYMREEEKLAHDVYVAMYELWGINVFDNIARSEQTHTTAVLGLLEKYGLEDPAAGQPAGVFTNPDLQALYDELITRGNASAQAALEVGALIEDVDIADLMARAAAADNVEIGLLYANLQRGSENHLRAFTGLLSNRYGVTYVPQYLDQALYDEIFSGSNGRGNGAGAGGAANGRGANGGRARGGPRR